MSITIVSLFFRNLYNWMSILGNVNSNFFYKVCIDFLNVTVIC
jgi:hypothetical protein